MQFPTHFTVRRLAIFVTLVCAYFGAWEPTKKYAVPPPIGREAQTEELGFVLDYCIR